MNRKKIFNDPVYGFISLPYGILFDLIEHRYFQRLRRIKQVGLTHYVYPGALHTRFHHALGALHLMTQAIEVLRSKGTIITDEEATAVSIAILLHDIGHGPFSHTLEHTLVGITHEALSLLYMQKLNEVFGGQLNLAIEIFKNKHPKKFLYQLVSGQLDMDRMDYLNRDSFFTGVYEGVIGYDRIIKMLAVHDDELVVEEKGIYSIEKFLIARRLMYWQVYLHKTVLSAEQMLIRTFQRAKQLAQKGSLSDLPENLAFFLHKEITKADFVYEGNQVLDLFAQLDDHDIMFALKNWMNHKDEVLSFLSSGLINRKLYRLELKNEAFGSDYKENIRQKVVEKLEVPKELLSFYIFDGQETNSAYNASKEVIRILFKNGKVLPISECTDYGIPSAIITKHYLCYPKNIF
ncbi:MAG: HD domain-containing protein [Bacteroidetes bacterium]|nr:HD domain-containing protein [Bacteroidota bacterium]